MTSGGDVVSIKILIIDIIQRESDNNYGKSLSGNDKAPHDLWPVSMWMVSAA